MVVLADVSSYIAHNLITGPEFLHDSALQLVTNAS